MTCWRSLVALAGLGAAFAAAGAITLLPVTADSALPVAVAAPATTDAAAPATDEHGYVDSAARCPSAETAVALGHTRRSRVVICATANGEYEYRGVRVTDNAVLTAPADSTAEGFVAHADGATYTVSPTDLVVVSGDRIIYRDTWIDYESSRFSADHR